MVKVEVKLEEPGAGLKKEVVKVEQQEGEDEYEDEHEEGEEEEEEEPAGRTTSLKKSIQEHQRKLSEWQRKIKTVLEAFQHGRSLGHFACHDVVKDVPDKVPDISIQGAGRLTLPLKLSKAKQLLTIGAPAPHGQGSKTILNPEVRRATQIDPSLITIASSWDPVLNKIKTKALEKLGMNKDLIPNVEARLYKLLLYEPGGHFAPHRDTEKEQGMFGTLIVQLPAGHKGGELHVSHGGKKVVWQSWKKSDSQLQYAAFYTDCEHQLHLVTSGHRLVLAYNLVRTSSSPASALVPSDPAVARLRDAVAKWEADANAPPRCAALLEHRYSKANLSFAGLKGKDAQMVKLLQATGTLDVYLALVQKKVFGDRYDDDDEDDPYISQLDSSSGMESVEHVEFGADSKGPDGPVNGYGNVGLTTGDCEVLTGPVFNPDNEESDDADDENIEYTGNEGTHITFFYHRAVVVFWPKSCVVDVARKAGFRSLADLYNQRIKNQESTGAVLDVSQAVVELVKEKKFKGAIPVEPKGEFYCMLWYHDLINKTSEQEGPPAAAVLKLLCEAAAYLCSGDDNNETHAAVVRGAVQIVSLLAAYPEILNSAVTEGLVNLVCLLSADEVDAAVIDLVNLGTAKHDAVLSKVITEDQFTSQMSLADICALAKLVCKRGEHMQAFARCVVGLGRKTQDVLAKLLAEPGMHAAAKNELKATGADAPVQGLITKRVQHILPSDAHPPVFSYAMPDAKLPALPEVERFLRSPEPTMKISGRFKTIDEARSWASTHFRSSAYHNPVETSGFSVKTEEGGSGSRAYYTLIKTRDLYELKAKAHQEFMEELAYLCPLLPPGELKQQTEAWLKQANRPAAAAAPPAQANTGRVTAPAAAQGKRPAAGHAHGKAKQQKKR